MLLGDKEFREALVVAIKTVEYNKRGNIKVVDADSPEAVGLYESKEFELAVDAIKKKTEAIPE